VRAYGAATLQPHFFRLFLNLYTAIQCVNLPFSPLLAEEHWLGLTNLNHMTQRKSYTLRIRLTLGQAKGIGHWQIFKVGDEVMKWFLYFLGLSLIFRFLF
jgi:hypothetical protein